MKNSFRLEPTMARNLMRSKQRIRGIPRLFQHAPLKTQQAEFAVHIETWIVQIPRRRMGLLGGGSGDLGG